MKRGSNRELAEVEWAPHCAPHELLVYRGLQFMLDLASGHREVVWDERGFVMLSVRNQRPTVSWEHTGRQKVMGHLDSCFSVLLKCLLQSKRG